MKKSILSSIHDECNQRAVTRVPLYKDLERLLGRPVVSIFTSFNQPVSLNDTDADMLQDMLQRTDLSNGLALIVSSPGGYGLAAERVVNICRAYSGTGEYYAIIPGKAKSAATIICMGASKICMAPSSELGPVDPQIMRTENGVRRHWSAYNLVNSYDRMFGNAIKAKNLNLEPYLQQLQRYDERDIETWRSEIALSESIAVKMLKSGMLRKMAEKTIRGKIKFFLNPAAGTKAHARPIYREQAKKCALNIEYIDVKSKLWEKLYELYLRTDYFVAHYASKAIENREGGYYSPIDWPEKSNA